MLTSARAGLTAGALALGLLAACGDGTGPQGVTREQLLGNYWATTFTTDSAGITVDRRSRYATIDITLHSDGSLTGRLFVPGGAADGGDIDTDLAGTFAFHEITRRVWFGGRVDTFVRDMSFTAGRRNGIVQLEGRQSFGGTIVHVVFQQYQTGLCPPGWMCLMGTGS